MKRKLLVVLSLLLVLSLGSAVAAEAAEFEGTGKLWAKGAGYATVQGNGVVDIDGHGVGTVRVRGADVLRAQGKGRRWDLPDGTTVFAGWRGHVHAEGAELAIEMRGGILEFYARGTGSVLLQGYGHYRVNGQPGRWTPEGVSLEF